MLGGLDEHDLERRPDVGLKQMSSPGGPIRPTKHHMGMQFWLSVLKRDVTHQRENLDLLADGDFAVFLRLPVEVAERRFLKRADRRESCAAQVVLAGEFLQAGHGLVARFEDDRKRLFCSVFMN